MCVAFGKDVSDDFGRYMKLIKDVILVRSNISTIALMFEA